MFFESHLLSKPRQLCLEQDVRRALYACPLQRERRFPHSNIVGSLISSDKGSYRTHLFRTVVRKSHTAWQDQIVSQHLLRPPRGSCCGNWASFVTRKTYLGNLGWSFFTTYPEQRVRLEKISSVQGNIILCQKLKTNLCGKLRNNNRCKIVSLGHAFATKY